MSTEKIAPHYPPYLNKLQQMGIGSGFVPYRVEAEDVPDIAVPCGHDAMVNLCQFIEHRVIPHPESVKLKQKNGQLTANSTATALCHCIVRMAGSILSLLDVGQFEELREKVNRHWEIIMARSANENQKCELDSKDLRTKAAVLTLITAFQGFLTTVKRTREDIRKWQLVTEVGQAQFCKYDFSTKFIDDIKDDEKNWYLRPTLTREEFERNPTELMSVNYLARCKAIEAHDPLGPWVAALLW